jgi:RHS repeat-associated protein
MEPAYRRARVDDWAGGLGTSIGTSYTVRSDHSRWCGERQLLPFTGRLERRHWLVLLLRRYYSPFFQRFIAQDPVEFGSGDANLYGYVLEQPTVSNDPSDFCGNRACLPNVGKFIGAQHSDAQTIAQSVPPPGVPHKTLSR